MIVRLLAAAAVLAACAAQAPYPSPGGPLPATPSLAGSSWAVSTIDNAAPAAGEAPTLAFGTDNRASGDSSCNRFTGPYFQEGSSLRFGDLASTRRACLDEARGKQELRVLAILRGATEGRIEDGRLIVRGPAGRLVLISTP